MACLCRLGLWNVFEVLQIGHVVGVVVIGVDVGIWKETLGHQLGLFDGDNGSVPSIKVMGCDKTGKFRAPGPGCERSRLGMLRTIGRTGLAHREIQMRCGVGVVKESFDDI